MAELTGFAAWDGVDDTVLIPGLDGATPVKITIAQLMALVSSSGAGLTEEQVRDLLATTFVAGTNMGIAHDDVANTITFTASGGSSGGAIDGSPALLTRAIYGHTDFAGSGFETTVGWRNVAIGTTSALAYDGTTRLGRMAGRSSRNTGGAAGGRGAWGWEHYASSEYPWTMRFIGGFQNIAAGRQVFVGIRNAGALHIPSGAEPSSQLSIVAIAADSTDANYQLMHNDGAGVATKTDTGFPVANNDQIDVQIAINSGSYDVIFSYYDDTNFTDTPTDTFEALDIVADIPAAATRMTPYAYLCNGATAATMYATLNRLSVTGPF